MRRERACSRRMGLKAEKAFDSKPSSQNRSSQNQSPQNQTAKRQSLQRLTPQRQSPQNQSPRRQSPQRQSPRSQPSQNQSPQNQSQQSQSSQKRNFRTEGSRYEHIAGAWLEEHGYRILEYNFRCRTGEIDLIARKANTLVFVEVKHRTGRKAGSPLEAVDHRKQRTICRCADVYRLRKGIPGNVSCRFDVVGIDGETIQHVENAFDYGY